MTRISKCRKAISPILATLLLIVIGVAAIIITYAWTTTYAEEFTPHKANVAFTSGKMLIDIGNSGTSNGEIAQVYVGNSTSAMISQSTDPVLPKAIEAGAIQQFTVAYAWVSGATYHFKVVPSRGTTLSFTEQAP